MEKQILEYVDYDSMSDRFSADVCIIGTGCGGASVAKKLADRGLSVIMVEQGPYITSKQMDQNELNMAGKLFGERGFVTSNDNGTALLYGKNVGGASVHYWADSYRTPDDKLLQWQDKYDVSGHTQKDLNPHFDEIEAALNIHPATDEYFNQMNQLVKQAAERLGWHGHRVPQARKNCVKSGHCMQGCVYDAKQSQLVTHLPMALNKGARILADAKAEQLVFDGYKAKELIVSLIDRASNRPTGKKINITADQFVVAAGGFNSSFFLMQQALPVKLPALGKYFSMNPSASVHSLFEEDIIMWRNIPAAWGVDEFRVARHENGRYQEGGYLLMPQQIQPASLAAIMPGFGEQSARWMKSLSKVGGTIIWMDDVEDELGEIRRKRNGAREVHYPYGPKTKAILKDSLIKQVQLNFEAGATEVMIAGHQGISLKSMQEISLLEQQKVEAGGLILAAPHPGGGCRMGEEVQKSVVDSQHKVHGIDNVYVADSSVFPTSSAFDPSLSIMAFSYVAADNIAQRF